MNEWFNHKIVLAATPQDEFDYRIRQKEEAEACAKKRADAEAKDRLDYAAGDDETKFEVICTAMWLTGKRGRKARKRVRAAIAAGADFGAATAAALPGGVI